MRCRSGTKCPIIACNHCVQRRRDGMSPRGRAYCTQQTGGLTRGMALRAIQAAEGSRAACSHRIVPRHSDHEIACNTLAYDFARLGLPPQDKLAPVTAHCEAFRRPQKLRAIRRSLTPPRPPQKSQGPPRGRAVRTSGRGRGIVLTWTIGTFPQLRPVLQARSCKGCSRARVCLAAASARSRTMPFLSPSQAAAVARRGRRLLQAGTSIGPTRRPSMALPSPWPRCSVWWSR
jgi:hypothetical protein